MCSILIRFRLHRYGLSTDIEKEFLHVNLDETDRDFTRFLWLSDYINPESEFQTYRFSIWIRELTIHAVCSDTLSFVMKSLFSGRRYAEQSLRG